MWLDTQGPMLGPTLGCSKLSFLKSFTQVLPQRLDKLKPCAYVPEGVFDVWRYSLSLSGVWRLQSL
jgi:hypothetical protein